MTSCSGVASAVEAIVAKHQQTATGKLGVAFCDLTTGHEFYLNKDEAFPSASTFKVFLLTELFRQIEEGRFSLSDRLELKDGHKSLGSGVFKDFDSGLTPTIKDYATLMMIISDNTATDILFDMVGRDNIKKNVLEPLELTNTKVDWSCKDLIAYCYGQSPSADAKTTFASGQSFRNTDIYLCTTPENDQTSPADMAKILKLLAAKELVSQSASEGMLNIMLKCQTNSRIPRYLPGAVDVAHKTGTMDKVANDAGIVFTEKGAYVLCLFYNGNTATEEEYDSNIKGTFSDNLLAQISRDIYAAYMN